MEIVTGVGEKAHVTSKKFRGILEGIIKDGSYILNTGDQLSVELVSNNLLKIYSGEMIHHGNVSSVDPYDEIEISNGTQDMQRIDLIVSRYTKDANTGIETTDWVCIQGTPAESNPQVPDYTVGNLQDGDLVDDCPFATVTLDGINVTSIDVLLKVVPTIPELESELDELNSELDSVKNPTFSTASSRANIVSGESNSTLFGKIAKWFSDLKAAAFCAVANNITTATSGYVLDARQGKALSDKITSGFTRMKSSAPGKIVLPNGAIIVYGKDVSTSFTKDAAVGGYSKTISLSSYGLTAPVFVLATGLYDNGIPEVSVKSVTTSALVLSCPVSIANVSVFWMVIG